MTDYAHGGDVNSFAAHCGCAHEEVIDLSSNINFISPSVDFSSVTLNAYPSYERLTETLAEHYGVTSEELELFNGGSAAIFALLRFFDNATCTIYSPAYLEYKKAAHLHGKKVCLINRFEAMDTEVEESSLVIFVNPSTPDGRYYEIETLMEMWKGKNCTILIDESFLEFCGGESATRYLLTYDKLYVLKSQTKFYGCAGVRVGIVLSSGENICALRAKEPLWKISALDCHFLITALKDEPFRTQSHLLNAEAKTYLKTLLDHSPLFEKVFESDANFFLVRLASMNARKLQEKLIPYRIMVRDCSNFDFLNERTVRIAVKDIKVLMRFEEALCSLR
ncbi:MAG: aminotransferase class I/II-fold pyridoxal phosphate-dependent enzyme [Sulfuricurvum sp.]|uniref:aminotransferase class I/II-fold pyridoxal phosphate-dependent enzyme n=1 Tax=Sulfuricurvum sp. TaxID=2025608 RepID=UPI002732609A|nr:aminotransferase class I/II-fold pyridoxal phosphate-dependent enzyme [Sulfuricurvum sp.]MDP2850020.1 aminotransferase class I/II-fold pyridoxal phosphate-dependent enzyme [Sulfuricurvum sp.]